MTDNDAGATPIRLPLPLRALRQLPIPRKLGLLERLFGSRLAREGTAWVQTANGVVWRLDLTNPCERWIVYGDYEGPAQMSWMRRWLFPGGSVIDSGANIGQVLLYLAPLPGVALTAFEPMPAIADWLEECLARQPRWQVRVVRKGLSDEPRDVLMQVAGGHSTCRADWYAAQNYPTLSVPMTTLDSFLDENGITAVRLWKLDVEGHELSALQGARRHLERRSIEAILVELSSLEEPQRLLADCGYELHRIDRRGRVRRLDVSRFEPGNYLALPLQPRNPAAAAR